MRRLPAIELMLKILFLLIISGCSKESEKVKKAEEFILIKNYDLALKVADEAIMESPTSPQAHLVKGKALLHKGEFAGAEESFKTSLMVDKKFGKQISEVYLLVAFADGDGQRDSRFMLNKAKFYDPEVAKTITNRFIEMAYKAIASKPEIGRETFEMLEMALEYCAPSELPSKRQEVSNQLIGISLDRKSKKLYRSSLDLAEQASKLDPMATKRSAEIMLNIYYELAEAGVNDVVNISTLASKITKLIPSVGDQQKFMYYSQVKSKSDAVQDANYLHQLLVKNPNAAYADDICFRLINAQIMKLDFEEAEKNIAFFKSKYPNSSLMSQVSEKESEIKSLK